MLKRRQQGHGRRSPPRPAPARRDGSAPSPSTIRRSIPSTVLQHTGGEGADRGCECVGYQAHDAQLHEVNNLTMNNLVRSVRATGAHRRGRRLHPRRIRKPPDDLEKRGRSPSTGASSGSRASTSAPARPTSRPTTAGSVELIDAGRAALVHRLARAAARRRARGLPALRRARPRLDQGRPGPCRLIGGTRDSRRHGGSIPRTSAKS